MARNEEKAQSMLNRFVTMKEQEAKKPKERRPFLASECRDLSEANRWRRQIVQEIGNKLLEIQNEGLGEHRLRVLNDEINKLFREKGHWERRIVELGGPNIFDVPNQGGRGGGYLYYGAEKKLLRVRELFLKPDEARKRRIRCGIYKRIAASYYGYKDDLLEKFEGPAEELMRASCLADWRKKKEIEKEAKRAVKSGEEEEKQKEFVVHVPLPDEEEIERMVLEKKKLELLSKYASSDY